MKLLTKASILAAVTMMLASPVASAAPGIVYFYEYPYHAGYLGSDYTAYMSGCNSMWDGKTFESLDNASAWEIKVYWSRSCDTSHSSKVISAEASPNTWGFQARAYRRGQW